jgi:hypothetical protein
LTLKNPGTIERNAVRLARIEFKDLTDAKPKIPAKPLRRSPPRQAEDREEFFRKGWFASDEAKRNFGGLCQMVNVRRREVGLLGSEAKPLLTLVDARSVESTEQEIEISIEKAKADWPAVTGAALLYGSTFRIRGKALMRAVLRRHEVNRHPAMKYYKPPSDDMPTVELVQELRGLARRFDSIAAVLDRRANAPKGRAGFRKEQAKGGPC